MLRYSMALLAGLWVASAAHAATWADGLFDELSKDFGSVPRGPAQKHLFRLVNKTKGNVTIFSVRVSCGCTSARALKTTLAPGEETAVEAVMDTTRFNGPKNVTIFVQFSSPAFEEVRLWVQANARNDFTFTPETFAFGAVKRGTTPHARVQVKFYGHVGARITEVKGESNYVNPVVTETARAAHEATYEIDVKLRSDTPVGKWYTDVWVKTNVVGMSQLRIPLTVEVESPLTVSPGVVSMGAVKLNEGAERRIIVRGVKAFRIKEIRGGDADLSVNVPGDTAREVHVLTVKYKPAKAGAVDRVLKLVTDLKEDNVIDFRVQAVAAD